MLSDTGEVRINVITVNDAPRVHDFTLATMEDTLVEFDLHDVAYDAETPVNDVPIAVDGWLSAEPGAAVEFDLREFVVDIDSSNEQLLFEVNICCGFSGRAN